MGNEARRFEEHCHPDNDAGTKRRASFPPVNPKLQCHPEGEAEGSPDHLTNVISINILSGIHHGTTPWFIAL